MTSTMNASSVAIAERYARDYFGLSLPITSDLLKSAFRKMAKELHTDTSGDHRTNEKFIAMKSAYDFLVKMEGMPFVYGEKTKDGQNFQFSTTDGTPLYELGLGLGLMKNGRDCERCQHKGYTEEKDFSSYFDDFCWECNSTGRVRVRESCRACKGTGKFTQQRSHRVVECRVCHGTGKHSHNMSYSACPDCKGRGRKEPSTKTRYVKCYECKGTGEIELMNPVWAKARMVTSKQQK